MGPVEEAVRRTFSAPVTLHTLGQSKEFVLAEMDDEGIVLLLGPEPRPHPTAVGVPRVGSRVPSRASRLGSRWRRAQRGGRTGHAGIST